MKKLIAAILIVCVAFAGFLTWKNYIPPVAETPTLEVRTVDYEALYATHDPDEIVMNVGGDEITWREFFYYLSANVGYINNMFAYYGGEADWDMVADETTGETIGENVWTLARQSVGQLHACTLFAKSHGAELTEEQEAALDAELQDVIVRTCGEGATEADFDEYLKSMYASRELYDMMSRWNYLDGRCFDIMYGEKGASISDEDALKYIEDNDYAQLNHILFLTRDMTTGEDLDEAAAAEKLAQAEALVEELRAAETTEELLSLYAQRKEELDEDTGKTAYPNGYTVTPETQFVQEFLDGGYALGDYEVSDPIKSVYGYHVMLRLPLTPDSILDESTGKTARELVAEKLYNEALKAYIDTLSFDFVDGFTPVSISGFVR